MINTPERFMLPTVGKDKVELFINWTKAVGKCEYVKMCVNGGRDILIPKIALMKLALYIGNEDEQDSLIPTKSINIHQFRKEFTIKVLEDLKAGQHIKFVGSFDVPVTADTLEVLSSTDTMG